MCLSVGYLDDLVLRSEVGSLCWRVFVHSSDELARFGLLAVQVEAVAACSLLHVAETRPQAASLLLHTNRRKENRIFYCLSTTVLRQ